MIRQLKPGEALPSGEPKRYRTGDGYIRLRWKVGVRAYLETYEHRVVGDRVTTAEHVHHRNHLRDDNRPENLLFVTQEEHVRIHGSPYADEVVRRYLAGEPTTQIAASLGLGAPHVYRLLQVRRIPMRKKSDYLPPLDPQRIRRWHGEGVRVAEMARRSGRHRGAIEKLLDELSLPRFRPGRPQPSKEPSHDRKHAEPAEAVARGVARHGWEQDPTAPVSKDPS